MRKYRISRRLSLARLIKKLPPDTAPFPQQLARYETGQSRIPADLLVDIAKALRVDIRSLVHPDGVRNASGNPDENNADKYRNILLGFPERTRRLIYKIIDGVATL